jgi:hypothetical protein
MGFLRCTSIFLEEHQRREAVVRVSNVKLVHTITLQDPEGAVVVAHAGTNVRVPLCRDLNGQLGSIVGLLVKNEKITLAVGMRNGVTAKRWGTKWLEFENTENAEKTVLVQMEHIDTLRFVDGTPTLVMGDLCLALPFADDEQVIELLGGMSADALSTALCASISDESVMTAAQVRGGAAVSVTMDGNIVQPKRRSSRRKRSRTED